MPQIDRALWMGNVGHHIAAQSPMAIVANRCLSKLLLHDMKTSDRFADHQEIVEIHAARPGRKHQSSNAPQLSTALVLDTSDQMPVDCCASVQHCQDERTGSKKRRARFGIGLDCR